ncbi:MAG: hypothetical protein ABIO82_07995 [Ginsengibacter sp.]
MIPSFRFLISPIILLAIFASCNNSDVSPYEKQDTSIAKIDSAAAEYDTTFKVAAESFADLQLLRYQVPGFSNLSLPQKKLAYYLSQATLCGRDIIYDQHSKYGLLLRKTLEAAYKTYSGKRNSEDWKKFEEYCGRFWFSSGYHHHYAKDKFIPACPANYFESVIKASDSSLLPRTADETVASFITRVKPLVYDLSIEPKLVNLAADIDNVKASSVNYYEGVTQKEVEDFYSKFDSKGDHPMWGLNSKLLKEKGEVVEKVWKSGGMYGAAIDHMIEWLDKATTVAENDQQKKAFQLLIQFLKTGNLKTFDEYNIAWVNDVNSRLDAVLGFIEVYLDPLGRKGAFEGIVSMKDMEATKRIQAIADQAQWFEDHSPLMPEHKKKNVKGIIAKAITVIMESGDAAPSTPIGINLPNNEWIRKEHGSKSVSLTNIIYSYNVASANSGMMDEFALNDTIKQRIKKWGNLSSDLHTDMHEVIGHASGQINPGVGTPAQTLKTYASALEEARADLVGLYYIMDDKLVDLKVAPNNEVGLAQYDIYMLNGLMTQLVRLNPGSQLEEAHMRNRALIARWAFEMGKKENVVEFVKKNGKTYVRISNYIKLRGLFGQLLREIQRIKSEGDYEAGKKLIETYGVKVDPALHKEILQRYKALNIKPYKGFIQPKLIPVMKDGEITDVKIEYPESFFKQMLEYGENYALLPLNN